MTSTNGQGHTKGPWSVELTGSPRVLACDEKGQFPICDIRGWGHLTGKGAGALGLTHEQAAAIQDANVRLIAAAPELLEALKMCVAVCAGETMTKRELIDALEKSRAALSRVSGEGR